MTGGKLGDKQSERIMEIVSKQLAMYSTIYLHICISLRCPLIYTHLFLHFNSITIAKLKNV